MVVYKHLGETPLECLERIRAEKKLGTLPLSYAGRLDPMAEGLLLVLVGDECKQKEKYLGLNKVYETEFLLGVETDTHDVLGVVMKSVPLIPVDQKQFEKEISHFVGKHSQIYPAYSSKTHNGKALFSLARSGQLPPEDEMPKREVEIYTIEILGEKKITTEAESADLERHILEKIALVKGDFRQKEIVKKWQEFFHNQSVGHLQIFLLRIHCSSGTYVRSLANEVGKQLGTGAIAFSIKRTQIGEYKVQ